MAVGKHILMGVWGDEAVWDKCKRRCDNAGVYGCEGLKGVKEGGSHEAE